MKHIYFWCAFLLMFGLNAQQQEVSYSISPTSFAENQSITITFDGASINEATWNVTDNALYLWSWSYDLNDANSMNCPTNGSWGDSGEDNLLTYNAGNDTYTITFVPTEFYNRTGIGRIGFLLKANDGNGDKKSQDIYSEVGIFQVNLVQPTENTNVEVNSGESIAIQANSSVAATWELFANDNLVHEITTATTTFNYNYSPTESGSLTLTATNPADGQEIDLNFTVSLIPTVTTEAIPDWIEPGINYDPTDNTKVGLALIAPEKDYVHVIGSFNNWQLNDNYVMKQDTENENLFWIELNGLTANQLYTFQYRTNDNIKIADPYSPLVLSPYDDQWIEAADYPNLPAYPAGQSHEVSVFQTGQTAYDWQVENFEKPAKHNLMVYEVLIRDFTNEKNFQSLIDKMEYFKNLNINTIELMPVMEFDGNQSWGYNPSFHYALDKAYGTQNKFKEFVDVAHQNGIAVILDIALNHATGRNPYVRMWCEDPDGDGYGAVSADNPFFNTSARHSYSVFEDFNHQSEFTQYYVQRVIQHWIEEYNIDGFRWDLTKGFTQNCTGSDDACTNAYQQDRVDVMKMYADYQWDADATSIVIFEHLGTAEEEAEWANYRIAEDKGILTWNILNYAYNQNTMGYQDGSNINWIDHEDHGFQQPTAVSYGESHDEERLMFRNLAYGESNGSYNVQDLATALDRQKAYGAVFFTVPGPKMIWQFGELGYEFSINRCEDGTISNDCRLSPKPIAFELGYDTDASRTALYDAWAEIMNIRLANEVFETSTYTVESGNLLPKINVWNNDLPSSQLNYVIAVANFTTSTSTVTPNFPNTGTWYNLLDETSMNVSSTTQTISLQPGEYMIFGNQPAERLGTQEVALNADFGFMILNNPIKNSELSIKYHSTEDATFEIFDMSGKKIKALKANNTASNLQIPFNLSKGMYLIVMKNGKKSVTQKLLVK